MFVLGGLILSALLTDWLKDLLEDNKNCFVHRHMAFLAKVRNAKDINDNIRL